VRLDDELEPAPDIAVRWEISPDGRTYTFYLREDVRFHDGRAVKAGDFKYAWERACDPATGSNTAATYLGDIVGVEDVLAGKTGEISGIRVIGDYTLEVTIDTPKSYFLAKLTYPTAFVVDWANVAVGGEWWRQPNGTGPFKLGEWQEENLLVLERNGLYYGEVANLDSVILYLWSGVPMRMYETGEIDVTDPAGPFYNDLQVVPELSFGYVGFNTARPPFDDVNIRRAFSLAVDKEKIVSLVFRDLVEKADGILPPGLPGYNDDLVGLGFDVERAKGLIASSSYGSVDALPTITITTAGWGGGLPQSTAALIQQWRDNLGVEVKVRQLEPERFLYNLMEEKDEMYDMGWIADYPHPQDFLDILFRSGADNNHGEYSNAAFDDLLDMAAVETDYDRSLELYRQAEQLLVDDAACLPLWFGRNYILVKPYVKDYQLTPMGFARLNRVWIKPD
jgi:oligopeptide transport system substrate-binding protein